jgi:hypothetical protein
MKATIDMLLQNRLMPSSVSFIEALWAQLLILLPFSQPLLLILVFSVRKDSSLDNCQTFLPVLPPPFFPQVI